MKEKFLSVFTALVMLFSVLTGVAYADNTASATVSFSAQYSNTFLCPPQFNVTVNGNLAESYGYTDSIADGVSALDVLVKLHEIAFGEDFTVDTASAYLVINEYGYVDSLFGITEYSSFIINGGYPNDGTESPWGGYNGTLITTQEVKNGDLAEFFVYQDANDYYDQVAWFSNNGNVVQSIDVAPETSMKLTVNGFVYMNAYLYKDAESMHAAGSPIKQAQLAWVDINTGAVSSIEGAITDTEGSVTITSPEALGTYYLTAVNGSAENPVTMSLLKVNVTENVTTFGACDLTALAVCDFDSNPNALEITPAFDPNITSYTVKAVKYQSIPIFCSAYVKATPYNENAVITATCNGKTIDVKAGDNWNFLNSALTPGKRNVITITVYADAEKTEYKEYNVTIPMKSDSNGDNVTLNVGDNVVSVKSDISITNGNLIFATYGDSNRLSDVSISDFSIEECDEISVDIPSDMIGKDVKVMLFKDLTNIEPLTK